MAGAHLTSYKLQESWPERTTVTSPLCPHSWPLETLTLPYAGTGGREEGIPGRERTGKGSNTGVWEEDRGKTQRKKVDWVNYDWKAPARSVASVDLGGEER